MNYESIIGSDRIDSRDIIEAVAEILAECEDEEREPTDEEQTFLTAAGELEGECHEWEEGTFLISEDTFEDYAQEYAEDIGAINGDESWPLSCIDWERAARELATGYGHVSFMGTDYLVQS